MHFPVSQDFEKNHKNMTWSEYLERLLSGDLKVTRYSIFPCFYVKQVFLLTVLPYRTDHGDRGHVSAVPVSVFSFPGSSDGFAVTLFDNARDVFFVNVFFISRRDFLVYYGQNTEPTATTHNGFHDKVRQGDSRSRTSRRTLYLNPTDSSVVRTRIFS